LALVAIVLLAALVQGRQDAEDALGSAGSIRAHCNDAPAKNSVSNLIATKGAGRKVLASRHDILRKQVLEARTRKGRASVKDFAVPR
jgi:ribosomal protein L34